MNSKILLVLVLCFACFGLNAQTKVSQISAKQTAATAKDKKKNLSEDKNKKAEPKTANDKSSKENLNVVTEGAGVAGIVVGKSTMNDVVKKFGKKYRWVANKKYSYQMNYDLLGLAFYMCQSDKRKEIFLIEIKPPYKAKTKRGVILGKTTKEETEKIYGKPKDGFEYRGVSFYYNNYGKRKIISEIDVTENAGIRQCREQQ